MDSPVPLDSTPYTTNAMAGNNINNRGSGAGNNSTRKKTKKRKPKRGGGNAPSAVGAGYIAQGPAVVRSVGQTVRFSNTEFVTDVSGPSPTQPAQIFAITLNPSNTNFTPWLSRVAAGYELYRFRRLVFKYTPTVGSNTAGMIVMSPDYDVSDQPPTTKQGMSAYQGAVRGNIWSTTTMTVQPMAGWYYVGVPGGLNPAGTDSRLYDFAKMYFGVFNQSYGGVFGELAVSYDIEFAKPDFATALGISQNLSITGSSINALAGTGTSAGDKVATLTTAGPGAFNVNIGTQGEFMVCIMGDFAVSSALTSGNPLQRPTQIDPNASTTPYLDWYDVVVSGTATGSNWKFSATLFVSAVQGTVLAIGVLPVVTGMILNRVRACSYKRAIA